MEAGGEESLTILDLRHSYAIGELLASEGLPLIRKLIRNNHVHRKARYTHLVNTPLKSAAKRISGRITEVAGLGEGSFATTP